MHHHNDIEAQNLSSQPPGESCALILSTVMGLEVVLILLVVLEEEVGTSEMHGMSIRQPRVQNDPGQAPSLSANQSTSFDLPQLVSQLEGMDSISFRRYIPILTTHRTPSIDKVERRDSRN
jgi:hypothetical protein